MFFPLHQIKRNTKLHHTQKSPPKVVKNQDIIAKNRDLKDDTDSSFGWISNTYWLETKISVDCVWHSKSNGV